jgi:hypothetical protein
MVTRSYAGIFQSRARATTRESHGRDAAVEAPRSFADGYTPREAAISLIDDRKITAAREPVAVWSR